MGLRNQSSVIEGHFTLELPKTFYLDTLHATTINREGGKNCVGRPVCCLPLDVVSGEYNYRVQKCLYPPPGL